MPGGRPVRTWASTLPWVIFLDISVATSLGVTPLGNRLMPSAFIVSAEILPSPVACVAAVVSCATSCWTLCDAARETAAFAFAAATDAFASAAEPAARALRPTNGTASAATATANTAIRIALFIFFIVDPSPKLLENLLKRNLA